ncbi:MAG: DUF4522 domain-containing protein [Methanobacterium sp.]|nr:DUF4522 domain-containing protein [Methanobacterium sp.]
MSVLFGNEDNEKGFDVPSMPVADLVSSVKKAIVIKQSEMKEFGISIKNVELTLKTVATTDSGASISLQIPVLGEIEFGSEVSTKSVQTIKIKLIPTEVQEIRKMELMDMDQTVVQSISSIIEGVKAAVDVDSIPLKLEEASSEFNFVLSGDSKISMVIDSGFESELSNTLKINFKKRELIT